MKYTQRANYGFQGLVADGMKISLYNLWRDGIIPNAFIVDEVLISVSPTDYKLHEKIKKIMIDSMKQVIPDVRISVDTKLLRNWCEDSEID